MEDNKKASQVAGTTSELFKDIKVSIDFENIAELRELLQKATDQLEQLEKTLKEINQFKAVIKTLKV
ncbi:hypothetical protein [Lysinibacillus parviboronicapiens]|uniref:hypothetical protein n=1 Tax=Lysinibacillus parviboronicapiens TaxID=436516 RepID=UPI000D3D873E|nr:hypothetical protein [Lysinibacillus parviboronicapiens]